MPGKSRKQKEKKLFKPVVVSGQPASTGTPTLTVTVNEPSPAVKTAPAVKSSPAPANAAAKAAAAAPGYVNRELLTITILAGIMLAVVIVLSFVLR